MNFGGAIEEVVTRSEFPLERALEALRESEMWRTGETVRQLRPESK